METSRQVFMRAHESLDVHVIAEIRDWQSCAERSVTGITDNSSVTAENVSGCAQIIFWHK